MTGLLMPTILAALLVAAGLVILVLPAKVLLRYERWLGHFIVKATSNEQVGLPRIPILCKTLGAFLVAFPLCLSCGYWGIANGLIVVEGGLCSPRTEQRALWLFNLCTAGSASYLGTHRYNPPFSCIYPANTAQIYILFTAHAANGGYINYRWLVNGQLQRQFTERYSNGGNSIKLNDDPERMIPVGNHEVYLEEKGELLAIVRFKVQE